MPYYYILRRKKFRKINKEKYLLPQSILNINEIKTLNLLIALDKISNPDFKPNFGLISLYTKNEPLEAIVRNMLSLLFYILGSLQLNHLVYYLKAIFEANKLRN